MLSFLHFSLDKVGMPDQLPAIPEPGQSSILPAQVSREELISKLGDPG